MATMVYRGGLHLCVESQFIEPTWPSRIATAAHFKLPSPRLPHPAVQFALESCFLDLDSSKSLDQRHHGNEILVSNSDAIPTKSDELIDGQQKSAMATKEQQQDRGVEAYVHPLVKRSRSTALSEKSLALCTENLGNETGVDFVEDAAIFSDLKIENASRSPTRKRVKSNLQGNKKFPPPLTTIAGTDAIRVRSYREDGRLIMEAVKAPARLSYFQVERSHGRLRLSILKSTTPKSEFDSAEEETKDDVEVVGKEGNYEKDAGRKLEENGNGAEIEIQKLQRPCRFNKAGKNNNNNNNNIDNQKNNTEMLLLTREPLSLWVATS